MICTRPFWLKSPQGLKFFVSCKECMPCLINKRSEWTARILMELQSHDSSTFCTLTYTDSNLPTDRKIDKTHLQLFLKRLRERYSPKKLRYFATGEYGSKTERPHYHAILFGFPDTLHQMITDTWGLGFTTASPVNAARAGYVAKYTTKKTGDNASFGMMSRRPGIGKPFASTIAAALVVQQVKNVPNLIRIGGKKYILDKYMREMIIDLMGPENVKSRSPISMDLEVHMSMILGDPLERERLQSLGLAQRFEKLSQMRETL